MNLAETDQGTPMQAYPHRGLVDESQPSINGLFGTPVQTVAPTDGFYTKTIEQCLNERLHFHEEQVALIKKVQSELSPDVAKLSKWDMRKILELL